MSQKIIILAAALCWTATADAYGGLRCNGRLIETGYSMAAVLALCGPPESRVVEPVPVRAGTLAGYSRFLGYAATDQWVYDRGYGKFPAVLEFFDGRIQRIDYLPFRSGD